VPYRGKRAALAATVATALALAACGGPKLPASVAKGTTVAVAWSGSLTSTNTAALTGLGPGNADVAALTRSRFAQVAGGKLEVDPAFGSVKIVGDEPFTVRYDLAKPTWSDGVPLDAADLLLAWAAGSDRKAGFQVLPAGLAHSDDLVKVDDFGRAIEVSFTQPVNDWNTALDVAVPAHVVGQIVFDLEDPMEAKQAVIDAIRDGDRTSLARIAKVWNSGFTLSTGKTPDPRLLVSSGPYRVDSVSTEKSGGQRVELIANGTYAGAQKPQVERIELTQTPEASKIDALAKSADVTQVVPTRENWKTVHELERRDYKVATSDDGTMWVLALRADRGLFREKQARVAFLRGVPRGDLISAAGEWDGAYQASGALLVAPGADGYEIATEDSGFAARLGNGEDAAAERGAAGVPAGAAVCVAYDKSDEFARGAFSLLGRGMAEGGWAIRDCGRPGLSGLASRSAAWQAVLIRVAVPTSPTDIALLWGGDAALNLTGASSPARAQLIAKLATTTDRYELRDVRGAIEKSIVDDAIAVPIAMNPLVTVSSPHVSGVAPRPGLFASLTARAAEWGRVTK
jgi:peptide/nickel transport system substrate-binding protein